MSLLVDETWSPLVLYLTGILGSRDAAQDAAQEAMIRLWERRDRWESGQARGLLFRIGRNLALDVLEKDRVRSRWVRRRRREPATEGPTPEEETELSEFQIALREALDALPQRRREVLELIRFRGLSYAETGEALGISERTVANHLGLALKDLRSLLAAHLEEGGGESRTPSLERSNDG